MEQSGKTSKTEIAPGAQTPEENSALSASPVGFDPETELRVRKNANWFTWIAVFALLGYILETINTEKEWFFSLAAPKWLNSLLSGSQIPAVLLLIVLVLAFGLIAYFSGKGKSLPYLIGLLLYVWDAFAALLLQDLLMMVFHLIVIVGLVIGLIYLKRLEKGKLEESKL